VWLRKSERAGYRPAAEKRRIEEFIGVLSVVKRRKRAGEEEEVMWCGESFSVTTLLRGMSMR